MQKIDNSCLASLLRGGKIQTLVDFEYYADNSGSQVCYFEIG